MAPCGARVTLLFLLLVTTSAAQDILQPPRNITVFPNQRANFTCRVIGGHSSWAVNGRALIELSPELRSDLITSFPTDEEGNAVTILTVIARAEYNGITVQCLINGGLSGRSENVTLSVQGPLSAVGDLRASSDASSVTIWWTAPFSLDVTGVDPDIWYSVLIYNVTDEDNPTAILCTDCTNITETYYTFTPDYLSPCHVYNFSVTPFNGAGQGESSDIIVEGIIFERESITAIDEDLCNVTFRVVSVGPKLEADVSLKYDDGQKQSSIVDGRVTFQLDANREYFTSFKVDLTCRKMENVSPDDFTTFDIQSPKAKPLVGGNINVTGEFINGSRARGCFLAIQCNSSTEITFVVLKRNGKDQFVSENVTMPASNYTVHAYDLEENVRPNTHPANPNPHNVGSIPVTGSYSKGDQAILNNASIFQNGSDVTIDCVPEEVDTSCIVVYRAYGDIVLTYSETFPVTVSLDETQTKNYTFAIFRMTSEGGTNNIDQKPFLRKMIKVMPSEPTGNSSTSVPVTPTPTLRSPFPDEESSGTAVAAIAIVPVVILIAVLGGVVACVLLMRRRKPVKPCGGDYPSGVVVPSGSCGSYASRQDMEKTGEHLDLQRESSGCSTRSAAPLIANVVEDSGRRQKEKGSQYAEVVPQSSGAKPPLPEDTTVQYQMIDIRATHGMARSPYAELGPPPANRPVIKRTDTRTQYVTIQPHTTGPVPHYTGSHYTGSDKENKENKEKTATVEGPPTVESVMSQLYGVADRWKEIAGALGFDEDLIDEMDTNNETDEACLQDCVEKWVSRMRPSSEQLSLILTDLEKNGEPEREGKTQSSDSGSSGIGSDGSPETRSSSDGGRDEMVSGVEETVFHTDSSSDETRGAKIMMPSKDDQVTGSVILTSHTFQEETPIIISENEDQENENEESGSIEAEEKEATIADIADFYKNRSLCTSGTYVVDESACCVGVNLCLFPLETPDDDPTFTKTMVDGEGTEEFISDFLCHGSHMSSVSPPTIKDCGRDVVMGGEVQVAPQQCTEFTGFHRPGEDQDTDTAPVKPVHDLDEKDLPGYTDIHFLPKSSSRVFSTTKGVMVTGDKRCPILCTGSEEPDLPDSSPQPPPEEKELPPPQPSSPQPLPAEVSPLLAQENTPPPPQPHLQLPEILGIPPTPHQQYQWLDPPANFRAKFVKWMHCGVVLGFQGSDGLNCFFGGSPIPG